MFLPMPPPCVNSLERAICFVCLPSEQPRDHQRRQSRLNNEGQPQGHKKVKFGNGICFVPQSVHPDKCTDGSAEAAQGQQDDFRDPPSSLAGRVFLVHGKKCQCHDAHHRQQSEVYVCNVRHDSKSFLSWFPARHGRQ